MTCIEFQDILADILDGEPDAAHAAHLKSCSSCCGLVSDLRAIASGGKLLCADSEPSPRVWANIQRTLEAEGIIRPAKQAGGILFPSRRWSPAWLLAGAAVVLLAVGAFVFTNHYGINQQVAERQPLTPATAEAPAATADDIELLSHVSPNVRASYAADLQTVNAFIRDAEDSVAQNPNDDEARHYLMEAYQEREMVYASAIDRSMQ